MYSYASLHGYQVAPRPARLVALDVRRNEDDFGIWGASFAPDDRLGPAEQTGGDSTPRPRRRRAHAVATVVRRIRLRSRRAPALRDLDVRDLDVAVR